MNEIMEERHTHRDFHIYRLILTVRDEVHYTEIFLAIRWKQSIVKPRTCPLRLITCYFERQSMSLNIFLIIGQITSIGNTELWFLSFWGACLKRKWQQSCHFLNYCIPTDTASKFGAKILLIIFLFEDTFENTIDDAMDPFSRNKKIHTYTKSGISGKSNISLKSTQE